MSEFCGKCDFCDMISDRSDEYIANSRFYIYGKDGRNHELMINNQHDAIRYYPYLVGSAGADGEKCCVYLSSSPFIDKEEKDFLQWKMDDVLKYWRKCKRKKKPFNKEEAYEECAFFKSDNTYKEIIERVAKDGDKAEFDGIHTPMSEYYRRRWYEYMIENGYDENFAFRWVYNIFFSTEEEMKERLEYGKNL